MHYIFDIDDTISCSSARHHLVGSEEYFNLLSQSYAEDPMYVTKLKNEIIKRNLSKYF